MTFFLLRPRRSSLISFISCHLSWEHVSSILLWVTWSEYRTVTYCPSRWFLRFLSDTCMRFRNFFNPPCHLSLPVDNDYHESEILWDSGYKPEFFQSWCFLAFKPTDGSSVWSHVVAVQSWEYSRDWPLSGDDKCSWCQTCLRGFAEIAHTCRYMNSMSTC